MKAGSEKGEVRSGDRHGSRLAALVMGVLCVSAVRADELVVSDALPLAAAVEQVRARFAECKGQDVSPFTIRIPGRGSKAFMLTEPLRIVGLPLLIRGDGIASILTIKGKGEIVAEGGRTQLENLRIYGHPEDPPRFGVMFARHMNGQKRGASNNGCGIWRCVFNGCYQYTAAMYLATELTTTADSEFVNDLGPDGVTWASDDPYGMGEFDTADAKFTCSGHDVRNVGVATYAPKGMPASGIRLSGTVTDWTATRIWRAGRGVSECCVRVDACDPVPQRWRIPARLSIRDLTPEGTISVGVLYTKTPGAARWPDLIEMRPVPSTRPYDWRIVE